MSNIISWERVNIGQHLKLLSGFPFPSDSFSNSEGFPLIRIRDILDSKVETYFQGQYLSTYIVRKGDILIGMDGDFHVAKWKNRDALLNQRVLKVDASDSKNLDSNFIYYWLQPYVKKVNDVTAATTVKHLSLKDLLKAEGEIPTISIQKKIASILQTLDQAIESTEALIKKYQQIKAGLMHDLVTRGITADGKLRPPKEQAPELYKETPIGWIPKDWDFSTLSKKARIGVPHLRTGPFGSALKGEHWVNEGHPVITIGALGEGKFTVSELLYIGDYDARRLSDFKLKKGDVVFSRVADVGRSVVIEEDQVDWIMSSNLMRISLDRAQVLPNFLQYQLAADTRVKKQIRCKVNAGGRDVANSDILNSLLFVWPDLDEQASIVSRASSIDTRINNELYVVQKLYQQKSGLMCDLLTGKVPVKIDEIETAYV